MRNLFDELDSTERRFGSGWISGVVGLFLAIASLATVICFLFPQWFTVEEARVYYIDHQAWIRGVLFVVLLCAFFLGIVSTILRKNRLLGFTTLTIVMVATISGGAQAKPLEDDPSTIYFGLDFFFLNLIFLGAIFIPLERLFKRVDQPILRYEWREDLLYLFISTFFVQMLTYLSLFPSLQAIAATHWASGVRELVASQPMVLQFIEIMFLTDLAQYWFHRSFHQFPRLWRFHAIHHSAQAMDWLAGSRMHVIEVILLRCFTTLPMYFVGFAEPALYAYIIFVYVSSVFIHSNIKLPFGPLQYIIATPRFHHWHHGKEEEAVDKNFAIHFPVIDMVFGTWHMPEDRWPQEYGVSGNPVPHGFTKQFFYPFKNPSSKESQAPTNPASREP